MSTIQSIYKSYITVLVVENQRPVLHSDTALPSTFVYGFIISHIRKQHVFELLRGPILSTFANYKFLAFVIFKTDYQKVTF